MLRAYTEDIGLLEVTAVDEAEAQRVADGLVGADGLTPTACPAKNFQDAARQARPAGAPPETV